VHSPLLVLAGVGLLSVGLLAIFGVLVVGIHRCDRSRRGHLFHAPESHSEAITRSLLVGVRRDAQDAEEDK
jgi:hypothetical protein